MADVATLGLEVRSDQVEKGARALDQLANSAKRAQAAANGVSATTKNAGAAAANANFQWETYEETVARLGIKTKNTTAAATAATTAVNAQSAAVQVAGQRAEVATRGYREFASVLGVVGGLVGRFAMNALSTAIGVLIAEMGKLVDWGKLAAVALNWVADVLQTIAPYAIAAAAALALLYAPAILGGVATLVVSLWGLVSALGAAALAFAAANPAAIFVLGITAAVAAANIFRDELAEIFGRDIVGDAKNAVNFIVGAFVGGYRAIKETWSLLPSALGDLAYSAANAVIGAIESMINTAIGKINNLINEAKMAALKLGQPVNIDFISPVTLGGITNPNAGAAGRAADAAQNAFSSAMGTDYVGGAIDVISKGVSAATDKIRQLAGSLTGVKDAAGGAGEAMKRAANDNVDAWAGLREVTEQQSAELTRVGQSAGGIIKGLIDGTLSWKDALGQALQVAMQLFQSMNGGKGLFGDGLVGGLLGGLLGFASGGFTGNGAASSVAGVVHGGEYVFSKRATDRIGVGALEQLHNTAKGYASGGHVTPAMPRVHSPANGGGNITIEGSTVMIQGGADKQTAAEFKRMMDERDRRMMRDLPKMVDSTNRDMRVRNRRP